MKALKPIFTALGFLLLAPFAIAISPFGKRLALFLFDIRCDWRRAGLFRRNSGFPSAVAFASRPARKRGCCFSSCVEQPGIAIRRPESLRQGEVPLRR